MTYPPSSQAGLATFRNTSRSPVRHCPKCDGTLVYGRRVDDTPWNYCTRPGCDYETE